MLSTASWKVSLTTGRSRRRRWVATEDRHGRTARPRAIRTASPSCTRWLDARSRTIRLADLLIEVENDLGFSVHFQRVERGGDIAERLLTTTTTTTRHRFPVPAAHEEALAGVVTDGKNSDMIDPEEFRSRNL